MAITEEEVRKLAKLASLALGDDEIVRMRGELDAIVGYVQQLQAIDTAGVAPVANVLGLATEGRPDQPGRMFTVAEALANAPQANASAFLVPKVVER